jgi:hypothetical integral membrane protein (TIGR02206 family)
MGKGRQMTELIYILSVDGPPPVFATAFHTFDTQHRVTLAVIVVLCALVLWEGRRASGNRHSWIGKLLGFLLVGYAACLYLQQALAQALAWEYSLPLDLCNLVLIACVISLFKPFTFTSEIAYFWGLGGVVQATLTPDLGTGFPSWDFTLFFWGHGATLLAIMYLISNKEFRPGKKSILRMMIALNVYAVVVGAFDAVTGWNYGYLCRKPSMPSLMDWLGPWPWYILSLELIALTMFLILYYVHRLLVWSGDGDSEGIKSA